MLSNSPSITPEELNKGSIGSLTDRGRKKLRIFKVTFINIGLHSLTDTRIDQKATARALFSATMCQLEVSPKNWQIHANSPWTTKKIMLPNYLSVLETEIISTLAEGLNLRSSVATWFFILADYTVYYYYFKKSKVNPFLEYDLGLGARQSPLQGAGQSLPV